MDILDRGYHFKTIHNEDGSVAHVVAVFERFRKQVPIRRNQDFALEFYGKGAGIRLGVTAHPRCGAPATIAAARRTRIANTRDRERRQCFTRNSCAIIDGTALPRFADRDPQGR